MEVPKLGVELDAPTFQIPNFFLFNSPPFFFFFLGPHPQHMEIPKLGVELVGPTFQPSPCMQAC